MYIFKPLSLHFRLKKSGRDNIHNIRNRQLPEVPILRTIGLEGDSGVYEDLSHPESNYDYPQMSELSTVTSADESNTQQSSASPDMSSGVYVIPESESRL